MKLAQDNTHMQTLNSVHMHVCMFATLCVFSGMDQSLYTYEYMHMCI